MRYVGAVLTAPAGDKRIISVHQPVGVSLLITPFNFPASMATRKIAPAIAAGCTMIIKPFLVFDDGYPHIRTRYHRATRLLTIAADGSR